MADEDSAVALRGVVKTFGGFVAVHSMDLDVSRGSFVTFLGPSGCGKTTTLRMIAGLEDPTRGDIMIKNRRINAVPIHKRNLGIVFQHYALFPHKTIFENVAFGLKYRDVPRDEVTARVRRALDLVQLPHVEDRRPNQLSGGQQQRIALARAIVIEPDVLLLDEPLSALDANLREDMRLELKRIQRELGVSTIFVTHDQSEALAMSDQVVVMNHGYIEQIGTPEDVYNTPSSAFVADFLGHSNILPGTVTGEEGEAIRVRVNGGGDILVARSGGCPVGPDGAVRVVIRAERLLLSDDHPATDGHTILDAAVQAVDYQGQAARYFLRSGGLSLQAINPIERHPFPEGAPVKVRVRPDDCVLLAGHADA